MTMDGYGHVIIGGKRFPNQWVAEGRELTLIVCRHCNDTGLNKVTGNPCGCAGTRERVRESFRDG